MLVAPSSAYLFVALVTSNYQLQLVTLQVGKFWPRIGFRPLDSNGRASNHCRTSRGGSELDASVYEGRQGGDDCSEGNEYSCHGGRGVCDGGATMERVAEANLRLCIRQRWRRRRGRGGYLLVPRA